MYEEREDEKKLTKNVNCSSPIWEPSSRALGEVNSIGPVIGSSSGGYIVIVTVVDQRVSKDEVAGNLRCSYYKTQQAQVQ